MFKRLTIATVIAVLIGGFYMNIHSEENDNANIKTTTPVLKVSIEIPKSMVNLGENVDINFTLANLSQQKTDVIKPILDVDSVSFELSHTPDQGKPYSFTYTIINPSVYEHSRDKMEKITLDKFGLPGSTNKITFSIPAIKQGRWTAKAFYKGGPNTVNSEVASFASLPPAQDAAKAGMKSNNNEVTATIETNKGNMTLRFFPEDAPNHVINFIQLARKGFYNNLIFHRVIKDFMIQGGCPEKTGRGGPGYNVKGEFNQRQHLKGTLSMARSKSNDSGGSQFFICLEARPDLDRNYTVFGEILEGINVLETIGNAPTSGSQGKTPDRPLEDMVIKNVTVQTRPVVEPAPSGK
ncbi:MAG: peptidylprolyl isomerase [Candidatus Brocadiia bacterium]